MSESKGCGQLLAATVFVHHKGESVQCDVGTEPSVELARLITNPAAWEGGEVPDLDAEPEPKPKKETAAERKAREKAEKEAAEAAEAERLQAENEARAAEEKAQLEAAVQAEADAQ